MVVSQYCSAEAEGYTSKGCMENCVRNRVRLKRDGTRPETRFGLSGKRTSPFKSSGELVQSRRADQRAAIVLAG
jgi:hypothetical protein